MQRDIGSVSGTYPLREPDRGFRRGEAARDHVGFSTAGDRTARPAEALAW